MNIFLAQAVWPTKPRQQQSCVKYPNRLCFEAQLHEEQERAKALFAHNQNKNVPLFYFIQTLLYSWKLCQNVTEQVFIIMQFDRFHLNSIQAEIALETLPFETIYAAWKHKSGPNGYW